MHSGSPGWIGEVPLRPRRRNTRATSGPCRAGNDLLVDPVRRRELTRYGVPAVFLLAVTIAVLLVKAGLNDSESTTNTVVTPTTAKTTTQATTTKLVLTGTAATTTAPADAQFYVIQAGDTLGGIAGNYDTTVEQLLTLNPDLDPNALQPGTRIRVG